MISFEPFWNYLSEKGITTYDLIEKYDLNPVEIFRLKNNHNYTLKSLDRYCRMFSCQPSDMITYVAEKTEY